MPALHAKRIFFMIALLIPVPQKTALHPKSAWRLFPCAASCTWLLLLSAYLPQQLTQGARRVSGPRAWGKEWAYSSASPASSAALACARSETLMNGR